MWADTIQLQLLDKIMKPSILDLPTGRTLEREIADIEAHDHDQRIRDVIAQRITLANDPETTFIEHDVVFSASRARLMAKLKSQDDA